jgi:hypothetical protein
MRDGWKETEGTTRKEETERTEEGKIQRGET